MEQNRTELNAILNTMENPMRNLIDTMKSITAKMGVRDYSEVLDELKKAEEAIHKAVNLAQRITYNVK